MTIKPIIFAAILAAVAIAFTLLGWKVGDKLFGSSAADPVTPA